MSEDEMIKEVLLRAYMLGWDRSGEGWNAEICSRDNEYFLKDREVDLNNLITELKTKTSFGE